MVLKWVITKGQIPNFKTILYIKSYVHGPMPIMQTKHSVKN
jgi:hypothetical protein